MIINYQKPEVTVLEMVTQGVLCASDGQSSTIQPVTDDDSNLFDWE